jgi:hypothetical protein
MMTIDEIKNFQRSLGAAYWRLNLIDFAACTGRDYKDLYTAELFNRFRELNSCLQTFDAETLSRIINPNQTTAEKEKN